MGLFHHLGHAVEEERLGEGGAPPPEAREDAAPAGGGASGGGDAPSGELGRELEDRQRAEREHREDVARQEREHAEDRAAQQHQWDVENADRAAAPPADAPAAAAVPSPYPTPPAQQHAIEAGTPPGPGGVVPYVGEGGGVRVGLPRDEVSHTIAVKPVKRK